MIITDKSIKTYLDTIEETRLPDILSLINIMEKISGYPPVMWGTIIGFGSLHYTYDSGREGDMPMIGLSNRKQAITLYLSFNIGKYKLLENLGKYKTSKSCLYIKKLSDVNLSVLESLIKQTFDDVLKSRLVRLNP